MSEVAVITRTKDRPVFLKRAIKSIAGQTHTDYTHVIVNDGGDKKAVERVISSFSDDITSKIKLFHRDESSNAPDTIFNESIDKIDSIYVAIHDDDDTWHKDFLRKTTDCLNQNSNIAGVVVKTSKVIEKYDGRKITTRKIEEWMPEMKTISLYRQFIDNQMTPISFLFRRKSYIEIGKFREDLPVVADWEFGVRLLQKYDVVFLDSENALAMYHHRLNGDNSFAKHNHRLYVTKVANEYLRKELESGKLGAGYIMSDLKYRQDSRNNLIKSLLPSPLTRLIKRYRK